MSMVSKNLVSLALSAMVISSCGCDEGSGASDASVDTDTYPEAEDPQVDWVEVPAGSFTFGSPIGTPCRGMYTEKEVPVTLTRPFLMSRYEITQKQWSALGFEVPHNASLCEDCPITFVDQFEAMLWCNALSHFEGLEECYDLSRCTGTIGSGCSDAFWDGTCHINDQTGGAPVDNYFCEAPVRKHDSMYDCTGYRLPTGPEWEYTAKAGTTTNTYNGDIIDDHDGYCADEPILDNISWYCSNSGAGDAGHALESVGLLRPIGLKQANQFGFYDILGNAREWVDYVSTGFGLDYAYGEPGGVLTDPIGSTEDEDTRRDIRGGSLIVIGCRTRAADQVQNDGWVRTLDSGFRPVRTLPAGSPDGGAK